MTWTNLLAAKRKGPRVWRKKKHQNPESQLAKVKNRSRRAVIRGSKPQLLRSVAAGRGSMGKQRDDEN